MKKLLLICFTCILGLTSLTGCGSEKKDVNVVCESEESYNKGNGHSFVLDSDGVTIKKATYRESISEEFLKKYYAEFTVEESYNSTKISLENNYDNFMSGNEEIPWIKGTISENPSKHEAILEISFDFTNEDFRTDDATLRYLAQFGLNTFYNKDEKRFEYDKKKYEDAFGKTFIKPICKEKKDK